jgi:hypothetical protein
MCEMFMRIDDGPSLVFVLRCVHCCLSSLTTTSQFCLHSANHLASTGVYIENGEDTNRCTLVVGEFDNLR